MPEELVSEPPAVSQCRQAVTDVGNALESVMRACMELRQKGLLPNPPDLSDRDVLIEGAHVIAVLALNLGTDYMSGELPSLDSSGAPTADGRDEHLSADQRAALYVLRAATDLQNCKPK